jgi:dipeptidyl aminopeptidase/acylaminoacyl peptidase
MELARLASPALMLDKNAPPLISFQGDADSVVLADQARRITDVYQAQDSYAELHSLADGTHSDQRLFQGEYREALLRFLKRFLS